MLTPAEVAGTAGAIAAVQRPDGLIPWFSGGKADPWNHVEAAMALTIGGRLAEAERAYQWLARAQHPGGTWFNYYRDGLPVDRRLDTNACSYVATGTWHHFLATGDLGFLEIMFAVVERAVGFALAHQRPGGEITWSLDADGRPGGFALLTGSSSVYFSLRCAAAAARQLGRERPEWELASGRLGAVIARPRRSSFAPKDRYAMDWYYPVLCGAVRGEAAAARLLEGWSRFVIDGFGVRCVSDQPWVTAAETAECALALDSCGMAAEATLLLEWARALRHPDGSYWTGWVRPEGVHFPEHERTTYSAAAVVLAHHAVAGDGAAAALFRGTSLAPVSTHGLVRSTKSRSEDRGGEGASSSAEDTGGEPGRKRTSASQPASSTATGLAGAGLAGP